MRRGRIAKRERCGMVLFEALVAMTILVVAALSAVSWVNQQTDAVARVSDAAAATDSASDYMDRIAFWTREDLDRHLGPRTQGGWLVTVERPTHTLYVITIQSQGEMQNLIRTTLYRPDNDLAIH